MGKTLIGILERAGVPDIIVAEPDTERAAALEAAHAIEIKPAPEAVSGAPLVLLLVKPQVMTDVLDSIASTIHSEATVISFAAGVRIDTIASALPDSVRVLRVMPNTPATLGHGTFGISAGPGVTTEQLESITDLLSHGGHSVVIDESLQDALTAVSGSGPAYVFYLAEAMIEAGTDLGLPADVARELAQQTLVGAAALLAASPESAAELRRQVTSPNGATHAAITTFDDAGVGAGLRAGVRAAAARATELAGGQP